MVQSGSFGSRVTVEITSISLKSGGEWFRLRIAGSISVSLETGDSGVLVERIFLPSIELLAAESLKGRERHEESADPFY